MASFDLEVATPEKLLVKAQVTEAQIPGLDGALGILPGHAPLLSQLGIGPLTYTTTEGHRNSVVVSEGFVEVLPDQVRVIANSAEHADEVDTKRAEEALRRARERLSMSAGAGVDVARALNAMKRAEARLAAARSR